MPEERKLVTVLFADIVGSTAMTAALDPEVMRGILRRTFDELRPIIEEHGGTVEKFIGDEVMAVFGVPQVHDDDADRAVRAAFALRQRVAELGARPKAVPLELRMGINTGETVAGVGEGGQFLVTGEPVNAAARIRSSAEPGEIVVGGLTHRLTQRAVEYGEPREFEAKGLGRLSSWPARSLRSAVPAQFRGIEGLRAPLIGRDEELSLLLNAFERVKSEGRPHLVTVFGAAGAGKSRLTDEFVARLDRARVREGRCLPYGEGITLWPVQNILRADAGIAPSDDLATAKQRLRDAVTAAFPAGDDEIDAVQARLEVLAGLVRADEALPDVLPADLSEELARGLRRYLEKRAAREQLVLVFEDIHWAAPALLELIDDLAEWAKAPLFILCLARPEFLDTRPSWGGGKVNAATVVLEPLTADETRLLVAKLLDIDALSEGVRSAVVERSEGNPLYVEEFIRLLIETGQIAQREGKWVAMGGGALQVPPTLQGLIAARIDTAPAEVKTLLQTGAVVGRQFSTSAVAALADGKAPEAGQLRDAVRRDLLVDIDERGVGGGRVYRFKHVLIRDVAYASVPKAERALLHDRYVRWYEEALGDRREDFIELIAYHAEQAYQLASEMGMPEKEAFARRAFDRLTVAATGARLREDVGAAHALYQRASAAADDGRLTDEERLELDTFAGRMRFRVEATPEARDELQGTLERARARGHKALTFEALAALFGFYPSAERAAAKAELRDLATQTGDPEHMVRSLLLQIDDKSAFDEDLVYVGQALAHARAHGSRKWVVACLREALWREPVLGQFSLGARHLEEWEGLLGSAPTRQDRSDLLFVRSVLAFRLRDHAAAATFGTERIELLRTAGDLRQLAGATVWNCMFLWQLGEHERALSLTAEVSALVEGRIAPYLHRLIPMARAHILISMGRLEEAREAVAAARAVDVPSDARDANLDWAEARLLAGLGETARASRLYEEIQAEFDRLKDFHSHFQLDRARSLIEAGDAAGARRVLDALLAWATDPLAERIRADASALLERCAAPAR